VADHDDSDRSDAGSAARERVASLAQAYGLSAAALVTAVLVRYWLDPWLGDSLTLVTLFGAVAGAYWIGGVGPAVAVCLLGYLACSYLFIPPRGALTFDTPGTVIGLAAYLFTCSIILGLGKAARHAQAKADDQRELLRVTLRSIGDAVIATDEQARVTYLNPVAATLTGFTEGDATGKPLDQVFRIVNEDTREVVESPARQAMRRGKIVGLANHTVLIRKDGSERPIDDSAAPIRDADGKLAGAVLTFRDVSERRLREQEKAQQHLTARLLAAIVESSDDAIISKSLDGRIESWNTAAERLFGYPAEQAVGRHISLVIPPERIGEEDQIVASLKAGRRIEHFETERVRADGKRIRVSLTISPVKDATGRVIGASKIVRDVTEQRRSEERERQLLAEAAENNAKFGALIENVTDFIGLCDLNGLPFFVNRAGLALVGLDDLEQAKRTPLREFFFPEDQPTIVNEFLPRILERGQGAIDIRFRHFKTGEARWMAYKVLTLPDANGRPFALATVSQDVTERKRLEDGLRRLAQDLAEADRRKNEFLAMLAHELRNPLAPIGNAARSLRTGDIDEKAVRAASAMIERQVRQMARLVDDLLDMSRITRGRIELRRQSVELAPIVRQAAEAVGELYASLGHELVITLPEEPVHLDADPTRVAQIIGNLLHNAAKFTPKAGHVWLTAEHEDAGVSVRVRDDGIGIEPASLPRVFDMFAQVDTSLERSRDGLGIGLTLVKSLVELHGGTVAAASAGLGQGSEFRVVLPRAKSPAALPAATPSPAPTESARRKVLVVDDNLDGAESLALLLELSGYETAQAHDGLEALAVAESFRPDVVLLDIGLPKLNGNETCQRLREQPWGKQAFVIALTGWGQGHDRERSRQAGFDVHLVKPVDHDALLRLLAAGRAN
jgi:PAS domain S-box-containing protein